MRPRLLALDLDGTLLTEECHLPMGHALAVAAIRRMGVHVAIATGRGLMTARLPWEQIGGHGPLVCFNGGWIGHPTAGVLAQKALSHDDIHHIMHHLRDFDGVVCCYPDAVTWVMSHETRLTRTWSRLYQVPIHLMPDIRTAWNGPSLKILYVDHPERVTACYAHVAQALRGRFEVVISQPDRMEVLPIGITKGWGVQQLAAHLGVAQADVWAAGDADNDLDMLRWAGHSCAMGQAAPHLRAIARHILPSIHARGLCALVPLIERDLADHA